MTKQGHKIASLHGVKDAAEHDYIIDNFQEGCEMVLIMTNVVTQGINIPQVTWRSTTTNLLYMIEGKASVKIPSPM